MITTDLQIIKVKKLIVLILNITVQGLKTWIPSQKIGPKALCPPIIFITACIDHLRFCKVKGMLIVPECPSSNFWPKLFYNDSVTPGIQHVYIFKPFYISSSSNVLNGFVNFKTLVYLILRYNFISNFYE